MKDFTGITETINKVPTKNITWSNIGKCWMGQIWDNTVPMENKWRSATWSKSGKNKVRPDLNLA